MLMNKWFASLGYAIGCRPLTSIGIALVLFSVSLLGPFFNFNIHMDLKAGFTSQHAPSVKENAAYARFFGNRGTPWYMGLFAVARNDSMLSRVESDELSSFYKLITKSMSVEHQGRILHYRDDLCHPFCQFNAQLWSVLQYQSFFKLTYPVSNVGPYKLNIGKFFFNRTTTPSGLVTGVGTVAMYFTTFINHTHRAEQLELFEEGVFKEVQQHNSNSSNVVRFVLHGAHTVTQEIQRGVFQTAPYYLTGAGLLSVFVFISFAITSYGFAQLDGSKLVLALTAILSPVLAALTSMGIVLLIGLHINMLVLISPFLTLAIGIGVDDAFLLTNTWMRQRENAVRNNLNPAQRLQAVFEKVGASIAVTSLTNVLGFALGCIAPVAEIRLFCSTVALSMLMDLFFQLTLYAPLHVVLVCAECDAQLYEPVKKSQSDAINNNKTCAVFLKYYSEVIASLWTEMLLVGVMVGYLYVSIQGIYSLKSDMDGKQLLPRDSPSNDGISIMSHVVWPDFLAVNFIIQKPPNFSDPIQYKQFTQMLYEVQSMESALGEDTNLVWTKDYLRYQANPSASKLDVLFGWSGSEVDARQAQHNGLDMNEFQMFINTEPYSAWQDGVRYEVDSFNRTRITGMLLIAAYGGTRSLRDKATLLPACREMAHKYPQYDMVPFDTDAQLVDVILAVPITTYRTLFFSVLAIGVVFFIFSYNTTCAIVAALCVASICTGVLGTLYYWGCALDPVSMVAVLMSAGLGVDFTVHIVFHYLNTVQHEPAVRIAAAFDTCALSTIQAGMSTLLVMLPVLFAPVGVYAVIAKAIVSVVLIGLIHGLVLVPILLTALPNALTGTACCAQPYLNHK